jgi:hypothetical protein
MPSHEPQSYRARAANCRALAEKAEGPARDAWLELADRWDRHASLVEPTGVHDDAGIRPDRSGSSSARAESPADRPPVEGLSGDRRQAPVAVRSFPRKSIGIAVAVALALALALALLHALRPEPAGREPAELGAALREAPDATAAPPPGQEASAGPQDPPAPPSLPPASPLRPADRSAVDPAPVEEAGPVQAPSDQARGGPRLPQPESGAAPETDPVQTQDLPPGVASEHAAADPPPANPAAAPSLAPQPDALTGTWWPDSCPARSERGSIIPLLLSPQGARAGTATCVFQKMTQTGPVWTIVARCSDGGRSWTANVRLAITGNRLRWASERGTQVYARCG